MNTPSPQTMLCMRLSLAHTRIAKKLDAQLSIHGINFTEFMILYQLHHAPGTKLRRIDLAERIGLTASGITRLVAPMEKIGLVHKEANKRDARVSLVKLSAAGQRILQDATQSLDASTPGMVSALDAPHLEALGNALMRLGDNAW